MFSYVSPSLAVTMYFVLIASTALTGQLIFRLIIRALPLASYVYLITFCVLSFRLMAVPVVNIMCHLDITFVCYHILMKRTDGQFHCPVNIITLVIITNSMV